MNFRKQIDNKIILVFLILVEGFLNLLIFYKLDLFNILLGKIKLIDLEWYLNMAKASFENKDPYSANTTTTLGPPLVIFPYLPFYFFSKNISRAIFSLINLGFGLASVYLLAKYIISNFKVKEKRYWIIFLSLVLNFLYFLMFPTRFSIQQGQPILIINFLITGILLFESKFAKGLLSAFLVTLKTNYLIAFLGYFKKNKKLLKLSLIFLISTFFLSLIFVSLDIYIREGKRILADLGNQEISINYYDQTIRMFFYKLGIYNFYSVFMLGLGIFSFIFLTKSKRLILGFIFSLLLSPVFWQHYIASLFSIYVLIGFNLIKHKKRNYFSIILLIISFLLNSFDFKNFHITGSGFLFAIGSSHFLIGTILLAIVCWRNEKFIYQNLKVFSLRKI